MFLSFANSTDPKSITQNLTAASRNLLQSQLTHLSLNAQQRAPISPATAAAKPAASSAQSSTTPSSARSKASPTTLTRSNPEQSAPAASLASSQPAVRSQAPPAGQAPVHLSSVALQTLKASWPSSQIYSQTGSYSQPALHSHTYQQVRNQQAHLLHQQQLAQAQQMRQLQQSKVMVLLHKNSKLPKRCCFVPSTASYSLGTLRDPSSFVVLLAPQALRQ